MLWEKAVGLLGLADSVVDNFNRLFQDTAFEGGQYGAYPIQEYYTSNLVSPIFNYLEYDGNCDKDGLSLLLTPRGFSVEHPGPMVVDSQGGLIWTDDRYQMPYNLKVQTYKGEQYLTFWAGDDGVVGHGSGMYYMLDSAYNEVHQIKAANGLDGDLHEFLITEQGTALITVYNIEARDLSSIGGDTEGWIWEAIMQEINIETGEALFEWRASEHIPFTDSFRDRNGDEGTKDNPFDWFHLNSIDKDAAGNYLISSRHLHSLTYIDGKTGEVKWKLGGKDNRFIDLSGGLATSFSWQHDARWRDNGTAISMFDNESMGPAAPEAPSRGLLIDLDMDTMTAKLRTEYRAPEDSIALSQGSMQILPNGNTFLGFGYNAMFTEYSPEGKVLCNVHFGPAGQFGGGNIQSYRIQKASWVGKPNTSPVLDSDNGTLYMSWMGATGISRWRVDASSLPDGDWHTSKSIQKTGFEVETDLDQVWRRYVRVVALDGNGEVLGISNTIDTGSEREQPAWPGSWDGISTMAINAGIVSLFALAYLAIKRWWRYRHYKQVVLDEMEENDENKFVV